MKIISDGTTYGTRFLDDLGNDITKTLNVETFVVEGISGEGPIRATLTYYLTELEIVSKGVTLFLNANVVSNAGPLEDI